MTQEAAAAGLLEMQFAEGRITCQILPSGAEVPELVKTILPIAMRTALDHLPPPPEPARLVIRLQPPPPFHQRALALFRVEPLAVQQDDEIRLQPGTDPLKLAFRLGHELSHWLVYQRYPARPPLWLDEGLANWIGAQAAEASARPLKQTVQRPLPRQLDRHLYSLEELIALTTYPRSHGRSGAFYWQAEALVAGLRHKLGREIFLTYLGLMSVENPPAWDAPLRQEWYFIDSDFRWLAEQINYESIE